jgi:GNAT superfamily N-acetyltransferase
LILLKINKDVFIETILKSCSITREHTFAFWKLKELILYGNTYYLPENDTYYAVYNGLLFCCISNDGQCRISKEELNKLQCISLNATMFDKIKDYLVGYNVNYNYKLHYNYKYEFPFINTERYTVIPFDFTNENHFAEASNIINQGEGDWMMPDNIRKIMREPVFDPSLWYFAYNIINNKLVGISISTYDKQLQETDIEWLYVLPQFHNQGVGRFLISETIKHSKSRSADIRVGGTNEFYKKCGFIERERSVWACKNGYSLVASFIQPNILP